MRKKAKSKSYCSQDVQSQVLSIVRLRCILGTFYQIPKKNFEHKCLYYITGFFLFFFLITTSIPQILIQGEVHRHDEGSEGDLVSTPFGLFTAALEGQNKDFFHCFGVGGIVPVHIVSEKSDDLITCTLDSGTDLTCDHLLSPYLFNLSIDLFRNNITILFIEWRQHV